LGAGAVGTPALGKHSASSGPLPVQPRDLLKLNHGVQALPGAEEQGRRVLLLRWGLSAPSAAFQMYGKAVQVWPSPGAELKSTQGCKTALGHCQLLF